MCDENREEKKVIWFLVLGFSIITIEIDPANVSKWNLFQIFNQISVVAKWETAKTRKSFSKTSDGREINIWTSGNCKRIAFVVNGTRYANSRNELFVSEQTLKISFWPKNLTLFDSFSEFEGKVFSTPFSCLKIFTFVNPKSFSPLFLGANGNFFCLGKFPLWKVFHKK